MGRQTSLIGPLEMAPSYTSTGGPRLHVPERITSNVQTNMAEQT